MAGAGARRGTGVRYRCGRSMDAFADIVALRPAA